MTDTTTTAAKPHKTSIGFDRLSEIALAFAQDISQRERGMANRLADVDILVYPTRKDALAELPSMFEDPDDGMLDDEEFPLDMKGVFIGEPMQVEEDEGEGEFETEILPDGLIILIAENIVDEAEAHLTLMHEVGHALGLDEDEVTRLGLGVGNQTGATAPAKLEAVSGGK